MSDRQTFKGYPDLTAADLVAVWAYANVYADEIEAALQAQEDASLS